MNPIPKHPPLAATMNRLLAALAADSNVDAVYVGGSIARGDDDEVSDIDLWVEGANWKPESIGRILLTGRLLKQGDTPFLNGVAYDGTILDIMHGGPPSWDGFIRLELPSPNTVEPCPIPPFEITDDFWMTSLKHRKNILRGNYGLVSIGIHFDRLLLIRAWSLFDSGIDPGNAGMTIFSLSELFERHVTPARQELLGLPCRNLNETVQTIYRFRDEMSRLYPGPKTLETIVRSLTLVSK